MYSLTYKFRNVFSVAYFEAGSYDDAILLATKMRSSEGGGVRASPGFEHIVVQDVVLNLYHLDMVGTSFDVYAKDLEEAYERASALRLSNRPVIRVDSSYI